MTTMFRTRRGRVLVGALAGALVAAGLAACEPPPTGIGDDWPHIDQRVAAAATGPVTQYPSQTGSSGAWSRRAASDWTSGFFPGMLWQAYERTGDATWRTRATAWTAGIEGQKTNNTSHDVGFQLMSSFGHGYRLTGDDAYRQVLLTGAGTLATRYNSTVGAIRSWDSRTDTTRYRVIIDNMMNLELLFWAAANGGQAAWREMAISHALTTAQHAVRPDGSTYHLVNYDQATGLPITRGTYQGHSDESTWARGQAWAVYGFTMAYRYTGDQRFLDTARRTADYWVANLPADSVPYWDFELPSLTGEPRDSSAAAIAASALLELSDLDPDAGRSATYFGVAEDTLASLSSPAYLSQGTSTASVLLHGTRHRPAGDSDTGLIYGDYYFVEALERYADTVPPTTTTGPTTGPTTTTTAPTTTTTAPTTTTTAPTTTTTAAPAAPFDLAVTPPSRSMARGKTFSYLVTVTPRNGFSTPVALSVSGAPAGTTVTFRPASTLSTSDLKVVTTASTVRGTYTLTVRGTAAGTTRTATVTLTVT